MATLKKRVVRRSPVEEEDDEDEPIVRRKTRRASAPAAPASGGRVRRRAVDDDETDDDGLSTKLQSGWGGFKKLRQSLPSKWIRTFQVQKGEEALLKFLDNVPVVVFAQHWCEWTPPGSPKSYVCPKSEDQDADCPLCEIEQPAAWARFNIAVLATMDDEGEVTELEAPKLEAWDAGITLCDTLERITTKRHFELSERYWVLSKSETPGGKTNTNIVPIKATDLNEDWGGVQPLTKAELTELGKKKHGHETVIIPDMKQLEEVAAIKHKLRK